MQTDPHGALGAIAGNLIKSKSGDSVLIPVVISLTSTSQEHVRWKTFALVKQETTKDVTLTQLLKYVKDNLDNVIPTDSGRVKTPISHLTN